MYRLFKTIEKLSLTVLQLVWLSPPQEIARKIVAPHRLSSKQQSKSVFWLMNKEIDKVFPEMHTGLPEQGSPQQWIICAIFWPLKNNFCAPRSYTSVFYCKILKKGGLLFKKLEIKPCRFESRIRDVCS